MSVVDKIKNLIDEIESDKSVLRYSYNTSDIVPGETPIYYSGPYWDSDELKAGVVSFLTGKWLSSGENVYKFEKKFSNRFKCGNSVMVNSGSSANLVMIAGIKKHLKWNDGDEIIVSPVGFPTTIAPIVQNNMTPIFVDIEFDTLNFDVKLIEKKITSKTRGIFLSPVLGNPCNMDFLDYLCKKYNLELILDGCDSLGTLWNGKYLTEMAKVSSCSFYPAHHITCGEGGMISSTDEDLISMVRSFSWWGRDCYCVGSANLLACGTCGNRFDKWLEPMYDGIVDHKYIFTNMGYNLKPLDLQGALGLEQLKKFDFIEEKRRESRERVSKIFEDNLDIKVPIQLDQADTSWFGTPIICKDKEQKDKIVSHLEEHKIQTRNYFAGNILIHSGYSHLDDYKLYPNSNEVLDRIFFVGAAPHYNDDVFQYIEDVVRKI
tara:strand:- start:1144 stop:2442 length:1299 start_codon:yes stop_codon:yes gene_type:complete